MATTFITTDQTGTSQTILANDTLVVVSGVTWTSGSITGDANSEAVLDGKIYGAGTTLGSTSVASDVATVSVGASGSLIEGGRALTLRADTNYATNFGEIRAIGGSLSDDAMSVTGFLTLLNTGTITADIGRGIDINTFGSPDPAMSHMFTNSGLIAGGIAIEIGAGNAEITNSGTIRGTNDAINHSGDSLTVLNSGLIEGATDAFDLTSGDGHDITNTATGIIRGDIKMGGALNAHFTNDGHAVGDYFGSTANGEVFLNSGTFDGDISFDAGSAQFLNTGLINGDVNQQGGFVEAINSGQIFGDYGALSGAVGLNLTNTSTGEIHGTVSASSANTTVADNVVNAGLINGLVELWGGFGNVINSGTIDGTVRSIQPAAANVMVDNTGQISLGIQTAGGDLTVTNSGSILNGVFNTGDASLDTVSILNDGLIEGDLGLVGTGDITVRNGAHGTVELVNLDTTADITFDNSGVVAGPVTIDAGLLNLENFGDIQGATTVESTGVMTVVNRGEMGLFIKNGTGGFNLRNSGVMDQGLLINDGTMLLFNAGVINGSIIAAVGDYSNIRNFGTISGVVALKDQNDTYTGIGNGAALEVQGAGGNDTLIGSAAEDVFKGQDDNDLLRGRAGDDLLDGGSGDDTVMGGSGDDSLLGGDGIDELSGKDGADTLDGGAQGDLVDGGAGDDHLVGDTGDDTMDGGTGNDTLEGGSDADVIEGGRGDDLVHGGDGNDVAQGGSGTDTIIGGIGSDTMIGGVDADVFLFESQADLGDNTSNRDYILDYDVGVDSLDLVGLGPLTFTDTGAPIGGGTSSVWLRKTSGNTLVRFDLDGDGSRDAQIQLTNVIGVTEDDLILA